MVWNFLDKNECPFKISVFLSSLQSLCTMDNQNLKNESNVVVFFSVDRVINQKRTENCIIACSALLKKFRLIPRSTEIILYTFLKEIGSFFCKINMSGFYQELSLLTKCKVHGRKKHLSEVQVHNIHAIKRKKINIYKKYMFHYIGRFQRGGGGGLRGLHPPPPTPFQI